MLNFKSQIPIIHLWRLSVHQTRFCVSEPTRFCGPLQNNVPEPTCFPWDCEYFMLVPLNVNIFTHNLPLHVVEVNVLPVFPYLKSLDMKNRGCFVWSDIKECMGPWAFWNFSHPFKPLACIYRYRQCALDSGKLKEAWGVSLSASCKNRKFVFDCCFSLRIETQDINKTHVSVPAN